MSAVGIRELAPSEGRAVVGGSIVDQAVRVARAIWKASGREITISSRPHYKRVVTPAGDLGVEVGSKSLTVSPRGALVTGGGVAAGKHLGEEIIDWFGGLFK